MTALNHLAPEARARLEPLLARHWSLPEEHPLAALDGVALGPYHLLALLGPKNNVGSRYFQLFLIDEGGDMSAEPLALGLHNSGPYPAYNWIELTQYRGAVEIGGRTADLAAHGLDLSLFQALAQFMPPGGHMMVEYDSPTQRATERVVTLGYPPVTSPTGYLLFQVGCRSYRDWYISEGGREGPRKLQGFRPLNAEIAQEKTAQLKRQLEELLAKPASGQQSEWEALARGIGRRVLEGLEKLNATGSR
jgi:hypothetical protein